MIERKNIEEFGRSGAWPAELPRAIICPPGPFSPKEQLERWSLDLMPETADVGRARREVEGYLERRKGWSE